MKSKPALHWQRGTGWNRWPQAERALLAAVLLAWAFALPGVRSAAAADPTDVTALHEKQQSQQRARAMARELVSGILDVQLQKLEENGLTNRQIYRDIRSMQQNIDGLIEAEMRQVVDLLLQAQTAEPADRDRLFVSARETIRQIVVRLAVERHNLQRRLKTAALAAHVKQLIGMQDVIVKVTESLPKQPQLRRESLTLKTTQDERDVRALYLQLEAMLGEVSSWGGRVGAGAADGLRILKAAEVNPHLVQAINELESANFAASLNHQQAVLRGLRLLLEKVEETQGLVNSDREALLELVRELTRRQQALREQTKALNLPADAEKAAATVRPLVDEQLAIHKNLMQIQEALHATPAVQPLVENAQQAAYDATGQLFDQQPEEATQQQQTVLSNLAAIEEALQTAANDENADKTAEEYRKLVQDLEAAREQLLQARQSQAEANQQAEKKELEQAKASEEQTAAQVAKAAEQRKLPATVNSRLAEAEMAANEAAKKLADADAAEPEKQAAVAAADEALRRAESEVEAALADAQRRALAVEIGELGRAMETLERAAATQRHIAQDAEKLAQADDAAEEPPAAAAKRLAAEQDDVNRVAQKIAEGVKNTAPEASQTLEAAAPQRKAIQEQLEQAAASPDKRQTPAARAATQAKGHAEQLSKAADQIRKKLEASADELAKLSRKQLGEVEAVREQVEKALPPKPVALADRLARLDAAQRQLAQAEIEQQRAAGKQAAAAAKELAEQIAQARQEQQMAQRAADDMAAGRTPAADATARQQQAAEKTAAAARQAAERPQARQVLAQGRRDALADALTRAERAATEAAKATLDGNRTAAQAAREEAAEALTEAEALARAEAAAAAKAPAGEPDAQAQARVTKAAEEAARLAQNDAPQAAEQLAQAKDASTKAEQAALQSDRKAAGQAQQASDEHLAAARRQLAQAKAQLAQQAADQLARDAKAAAKLAQAAAKVDPAAAAALRQADRAAQKGVAARPQSANDPASTPPGDAPSQVAQAEQQATDAAQRATANLHAREQRIRQDQAIAEALVQLARQQQQAAQQIAENRKKLEELAQQAASAAAAQTPQAGSQQPGNQQANAAPPMAQNQAPSRPATPNQAAPTQAAAQPSDNAQPNANKPNPAAARAAAKAQQQAAQQLAQAVQQFSQNVRATGQGAEQISGQREVANQPIREALEIASRLNPLLLPRPQASPDRQMAQGAQPGDQQGQPMPGGQQPQQGTPGQQPGAAQAQAAAASQQPGGQQPSQGSGQAPGESQSASAQGQPGEGGQPGQPGPGSQAAGPSPSPGSGQPAAMGSQFVPASPQTTAHMMAGPQAMQQIADLLAAAAQGTPSQPSPGQMAQGGQQPSASQGESPQGPSGQTSTSGDGGTPRGGANEENAERQQGPLQAANQREGTDNRSEDGNPSANVAAREYEQPPWFAKLPPELREAMQVEMQRRPPRAYEERLRRYFQSID